MTEENNNLPSQEAADSKRSEDRRLSTCSTLGRWHWWWLRKFAAAKLSQGSYTMGVGDWSGTVQGKALAGLILRGLIGMAVDFGSVGLLTLTNAGIDALKYDSNAESICT